MCSYRRPKVGDIFVAEHGAPIWMPTVYHAIAKGLNPNRLVLVWDDPAGGWMGIDWHPGTVKWHIIDEAHADHVSLYKQKEQR